MSNNQGGHPPLTPVDAFVWPTELRQSHNFAVGAQPIEELGGGPKPPPLRPQRPQQSSAVGIPTSVQAQREPVRLEFAPKPSASLGAPIETDFQIESRLDGDDPPFHAPATWRSPGPPVQRGRNWNWSERSTAAFLGFAAGVLIIVPAVMLLGPEAERNGFATAAPTPASMVTLEPARVDASAATEQVAQASTTFGVSGGSWFDSNAATKVAHETVAPVRRFKRSVSQKSVEDAENRARTAISEGRVVEARNMLRVAASPETPRLWFVLAETYDPRTNGGSGEQAVGQAADSDLAAADIKFARYYYQRALTYGIEDARHRIESLPTDR